MIAIDGIITMYSESAKLAEYNAKSCEEKDDTEKAEDWREDAKFSRKMISLLKELQVFREQPKIIICCECKHRERCPSKIDCGGGLYYYINSCSNGEYKEENEIDG